jgi:nicotinate-nucleotide adenylyltransferase
MLPKRQILQARSVMKRLCFGGSFNPIHHGHLLTARAVAEAQGFDTVVLIPSAEPPHKPDRADLAPAEHRLAMCRLAIEASADSADLFEVSDIELGRYGPSYTIDTARILTRQGLGPVYWLIGSDTVPQLPTWHEPEALLREIHFITIDRPGSLMVWQALAPEYQALQAGVVQAPLIEISATDIRRRVAAGRSIDYLTPQPVVSYIRDYGLYRPINAVEHV